MNDREASSPSQFWRRSLRLFCPVQSFRGGTLSNTDGIFVTESSFGPFEQDALYAVHNDGNTVDIDWMDIAEGLSLTGCHVQ